MKSGDDPSFFFYIFPSLGLELPRLSLAQNYAIDIMLFDNKIHFYFFNQLLKHFKLILSLKYILANLLKLLNFDILNIIILYLIIIKKNLIIIIIIIYLL